jgi:RNA polymerase sigma factor (sigma-70 family)
MGANLETMKRFLTAWQQSWETACRSFIASDFECIEPPGLPQSGTFRGWDAPIQISNIYRGIWDVDVLDYQFWDEEGSDVVVSGKSAFKLSDGTSATGRLRVLGHVHRTDFRGVLNQEIPAAADDDLILRVHEALEQLAVEDPVKAEVVKLRFFVGLENEETARLLGVSEKTVRRHWSYAKARLYQLMSDGSKRG